MDVDTLPGFCDLNGIRVSPIGDNGDTILAIGHHDQAAAARAFIEFGKTHLGWTGTYGGFSSVDDCADYVEQQWGRFRSENPDPGEPADSNWVVEWFSTRQPGTHPVTVLDAS